MAKTYDTYKDSGIAWIGNIPSGWSTIKNKYLYSLLYSGGTPTASEGKFYAEEGCPFVAISDMSTTEYVTETKKHLTEDGIANKNLKILPSGTILYSIYATVGVVSELMIDATISQAMLAIELKSKINKSYYKYNLKAMKDYILQTMAKCGLQDYMLHRYPHQFSGGQRQRICIARALAVKPKFVVCDECVSALDVSIQSQIINLLEELKEKEGLTYLFISHDLSVVRYISDRICVMYLGNIVELADAETIFKDPRHPYTIALLSSIPTTDLESLDKERILLEGNIPSPIKPPSGCKFHTRCYMACDKCDRVPPPLVEVEPGHFVACHRLEKKLDEDGNYLFELPKMVKKTIKTAEIQTGTVNADSSESEKTDFPIEELDAKIEEQQNGVVDMENDVDAPDAIIAEETAKRSLD